MKPVHLPRNLDLKGLLANDPPAFRYHIDEFKYILSLIIRLKSQYKDYLESDFVPINAQILQDKIRLYNKLLNYLLEHKVIETDGKYNPGEKSRGYNLTKFYHEEGYIIDNISKFTLIRKTENEIRNKKALKKYEFLTKWFNKNLQIDSDKAVTELKELLNKEKQDEIPNANERFRLRLLTIEKVNKQMYHLNVDGTSGRFHSNLTNLKSDLRNYLTYDRKQLCSVDIKNSQPFLSTIFFNPGFYSSDPTGVTLQTLDATIFKKLNSYFSSILSIIKSNHITILVKSDISQCQNDLERYCTLVDKGTLYPYLNEQYFERTGEKFDLSIPAQKKQLKDIVFSILYSSNSYEQQAGAWDKRFFMELFPTVYEVFRLIKKKGNNVLPIILQLLESEIVLNRTAKGISKAYPELPIFTIHDSIITLAGQGEMVRQELKAQCETAIGLQPTLHIEYWR